MWFVASTTSWAMFALGMVLMISILLRRSFRYQRSARREEASAKPRPAREPSRKTPLLDAPDEILRWQVEMHETARDLKGELDSKMGALQALVRLAQEETARLEAAIAEAKRLGIAACPDTLAELEQLLEQEAGAAADALGNLPPVSNLATHQLVKPAECRQKIYSLADQGHSPTSIAELVGATIGEVEMVLNLRTAE